ncbi:MAG: non-ribosomal peptide synthetase, partial [Ferruginibacter sp.]
ILNDNEQLAPVGVSGEICIGGAGLARGYLNRPELTAEKFIHPSFNSDPATAIYKTGDLGRWLPGGNIEYLGRKDDQVKIRGYRIELGEIESVLQQSPGINQAVVIVNGNESDSRKLIAYVVAEAHLDKHVVNGWLKTRLPAYMIPSFWVEMDSFPLTPNGKIDRKNLPLPATSALLDNQYIAPATEVEKKLVDIWEELLKTEKIGTGDNFFERGGNSLLAMRMVPMIERKLQLSIPIRVLFQFTTIGELSKYLQVQETSIPSEKGTEFQLLDV